jgi:hypothetical protein
MLCISNGAIDVIRLALTPATGDRQPLAGQTGGSLSCMLFCKALQASSQPDPLNAPTTRETAACGVNPPMMGDDRMSLPKHDSSFCCQAEARQHLGLTCGWPPLYISEYKFIIDPHIIFHMHCIRKAVRPVKVAAADRLMMGRGLDIVDEKMPGGSRLGAGRLFLW